MNYMGGIMTMQDGLGTTIFTISLTSHGWFTIGMSGVYHSCNYVYSLLYTWHAFHFIPPLPSNTNARLLQINLVETQLIMDIPMNIAGQIGSGKKCRQ